MCQMPEEVSQVVGEREQLQPRLDILERVAGELRPVDRETPAFLGSHRKLRTKAKCSIWGMQVVMISKLAMQ